jgi:NADPH:quinone reductase-like Zn-dependent oxidoreductase
VTLPDDSDPAAIAAGMNPAMSSWLALRKRIDFALGKRVLVLGATGNAGLLAVQVAKRLGAGEVIAAGRDPDRLAALGADSALALTDDAALATAADVDVVIDYLWGAPAERVMTALVTHRADRGRALDWIQIGSVVGPTAAIPSAALRAANLRVLGSGQGSIPTADSVGELPALAAEITSGALTVNPTAIPLSDVEAAWSAPIAPGTRVVLEP